MDFVANVVGWIVLGAVVGWVVSIFLGRDFRGGFFTYVIIGIITMVLLGLLLKLFWILLVLSVAIIGAAWLLDMLRSR
ncbi:MAG: hypothetical protein HPY44_17775 [Armatimonadetes bacterium]|nr:hypothetical protein [Armatimonadota bacterium]